MSSSLARKLNLGVAPTAASVGQGVADPASQTIDDVEAQVAAARKEGFEEGRQAGEASGRSDERARIGEILNSEQAEGRRDMAAHLALSTALPAAEALALLATSPQAAKAGQLGAKIKAEAIPSTGTPTPADPPAPESRQAEIDRHVAGLSQFDPPARQ